MDFLNRIKLVNNGIEKEQLNTGDEVPLKKIKNSEGYEVEITSNNIETHLFFVSSTCAICRFLIDEISPLATKEKHKIVFITSEKENYEKK